MGPLGFSVDQLMELAGLSVASAFAEQYPQDQGFKRVLIIAGMAAMEMLTRQAGH
jgi:NAD(P)H-hydrate epimerase